MRRGCGILLAWVDVDGLPARRRVHPDQRMDRLDGLPADSEARCASAVGLRYRTVHSVQGLEVLLEEGTERRV